MKYEFDKKSGALFVDRILHTPMRYPANYGFLPHSLSPDGDPLDAMVVARTAVGYGLLAFVPIWFVRELGGDGVAGCSWFTVESELRAGSLVIVQLRGWKVRRTISIIRHREAALTPSAREFLTMLHERWGRPSPQRRRRHREGSSPRR